MVRTQSLSLQAAVNLFLNDRKAQRMAAGTIRFYKEKLGNFVDWCATKDVTTIDDVMPRTVRLYFLDLPERGYSDSTQNMLGRAVRSFLKWCVAEPIVKHDPLGNVKIPSAPKEVLPALRPQDIRALLDHAPDVRARAMILVLLDTGVRAREFVDLNGGDVDVDSGTVRVRRGKTGKSRMTFISHTTLRALVAYFREQGWPENDDALWRHVRSGGRLTDSGIRQILKTTAKAAGVKKATPHAFRRTFAIWSLRQGIDLHTLARMMGHADVQVLRQYLDLDDTDTLEAHRKADIVRHFLK